MKGDQVNLVDVLSPRLSKNKQIYFVAWSWGPGFGISEESIQSSSSTVRPEANNQLIPKNHSFKHIDAWDEAKAKPKEGE